MQRAATIVPRARRSRAQHRPRSRGCSPGPVRDHHGGRPPPPAGTRVHRVPVVMPGLWDCHGHFMGIRATNVEEIAKTSLPVLTARSVADANRALVAGFTSVRDLVGLGVHLARVVDEGTIPGPHIYGGGAMLGPTAGHRGPHHFPKSYIQAPPPPG